LIRASLYRKQLATRFAPGIVSLRSPKIRPFSEQAFVLSAIAPRTIERGSAVIGIHI
jgi:hypothetical protein